MFRSYCIQNLPNPSLSTEKIINGSSSKLPNIKFKAPKKSWYGEINYKPFLGLIYTVFCSIFIMMTSIFVKKLTYIDSSQLSMIRNLGVLLCNIPILLYSVKKILGPKKYRCLLLFRAFFGATAVYLQLLAYRLLPLVEASIVLSTVPALVTVMARIFLKESFGFIQGCAVLLTVAGMLLSIRLPELMQSKEDSTELSNSNYIMGLSCAVGCVMLLSFTAVAVRKMQDVPFSVHLLYIGLLGTLENGLLTGFLSNFSLPRCGWDQVQVILIGIFGFLGDLSFTIAIQVEAVAIVSIVRTSSDIIVALVMQVLFFDVVPDMYNIGGALMVMASVAIIGLRKWLTTLPEDHIKRRKLKYLLL